MRGLQNVMRAQALLAAQGHQSARMGIVSAYDPSTYSVKVQFPPDASETGWIPLTAIGTGQGWGVCVGPSVGDQVAVAFQEGSADAGAVLGRLFDNLSVPPAVPSGEIWLVHAKGAFFKLTNDGKATFSDAHGASVALNGDGTVTSTGTWTHQGSLEVKQTLKVDGGTTLANVTSNGHDISSTHQHLNSGGTGLGGVPQ